MADTLYTLDGKMHVLIGSTTLASLVEEYMGPDAGERVRTLENQEEEK